MVPAVPVGKFCAFYFDEKIGSNFDISESHMPQFVIPTLVPVSDHRWRCCCNKIYSSRLGLTVVDLCYFAVYEDFSL